MPHSVEWAKRLLSAIPSDPQALLERPTYADATFLGLFLEELDERIFRDPARALKWARVAPALALAVPEGEGPAGRQAHRAALIRSYATFGGALRAAGRPDEADEPYEIALRIADSEAISATARADLLHRLAYLRICQGRLKEAAGLVAEARDLCRDGDDRLLVEILLKEGYIHAERRRFREAIACFGEVLQRVNPKDSPAAARAHHCAVHNLAFAVAHPATHPDEAAQALPFVEAARALIRGQKHPWSGRLPRYKLKWVEGLVWLKLCCPARAARNLRAALKGFQALELPYESALVALDLGRSLRILGEPQADLALETFQGFRVLSGNTATLRVLSAWLDAARQNDGIRDAITRARAVVEARMPAA